MLKGERTISRFVADIQRKNLPIDLEDAYQFGHAVIEHKPPRGWFKRLVQNAQYKDKPTFDNDLSKLAEIARHEIGSNPYAVTLTEPDKSDFWIYGRLLELGVPPAIYQFDTAEHSCLNEINNERLLKVLQEPGLSLQEKIQLSMSPGPFETWLRSLPPELPVCGFDDFSISGAQFDELFCGDAGRNLKLGILKAFFCYASPSAREWISFKSGAVLHQSGADIRPFSEDLKKSDLQFLTKLDHIGTNRGDVMKSDALFWTWYKVPDCIPEILTGTFFPPLIREENFQPPYKSRV